MQDEEFARAVFVERLDVLELPDAIVDAPGLFSRKRLHRSWPSKGCPAASYRQLEPPVRHHQPGLDALYL
jgi:hypothetical protein